MTKLEEYTAKAAESLAAIETAGNDRDRAHHRRAHSIWRKLIVNVGEAEQRAARAPEPKLKPAKIPPPSRPW